MTLEEKASLTVGRDVWTTQPIERLGIPSIWLSDGPTGLRKARGGMDMSLGHNIPATCFPTESALGATWDTALVHDVGAAIALEAQANDVQIVLGPGVNLKRSPLCGRNFEYFSEDPVLTGKLAAAFVGGLQEHGVGASVKHLVANECETNRMITDSRVEERVLRELYLRPFEIAVAESQPWTMMAAYNRLNGAYCTENPHLLHEIVEQDWGYRGCIVSDWYAVNNRATAVDAGMHLQMPGSPTVGAVVQAVREGRLAETRLDQIARALLRMILRADAARRPGIRVDMAAHHALARRAAAASVVLLKNEGNLLPLAGESLAEVALIGAFARVPRYQGAGSSQVVPSRAVDTVHEQLIALIGSSGHVTYAAGYDETGETSNAALLDEARAAAAHARVAVVMVWLPPSYELEGADRADLRLPPAHDALVEAVRAVQPRTVVVLTNGAPVALPWAARVPAILEAYLGGQAGGAGVAAVLIGHVNPSGKLAETFPIRIEDTPALLSFPHDGSRSVVFGEGLLTGYRWYDARHVAPLFSFGHGLSYTTFSYEELTLDKPVMSDDEPNQVSVRIRNTGRRADSEVALSMCTSSTPACRPTEIASIRQGCPGAGSGSSGVVPAGVAGFRRLRSAGRGVDHHQRDVRHPGRRVLARYSPSGVIARGVHASTAG